MQANSEGNRPQATAEAKTAVKNTREMLCTAMNSLSNSPMPRAIATPPALPR